jgi:hypothetical protein
MKAVVSRENAEFLKLAARKRVIDTLWADRLVRYGDTNDQLKSFIVALPEAMGIANGLTSHYRYLSEAVKEYIYFDIWASKALCCTLLLDSANEVGLVPVVEQLKGIINETVDAVCTNVVQEASLASAPQTVMDVNTSFAFCMEQLDVATLAAAEKFEAELAAQRAHKAPNAVVAGLTRVLQWAKLPETDVALAEARMNVEADERRRYRQLRDIADIHHALKYVDEVSRLLETCTPTAANANKTTAAASLSPPSAFPVHALQDEGVIQAIRQLQAWEEGATAFLIQSQARAVLKAQFDLMALPLTTIHEPEKKT